MNCKRHSLNHCCQRDEWANFNADQLTELYDSDITSVLDRLIPAKTVNIHRRPFDPWMSTVRRLERSSRHLKTPETTAAWYSKHHEYPALLRRKRKCFWQAKIEAKPCQLWWSVGALLGRGKTPLPADIDAAQFHRFFDEIAGVRSPTSDAPPPSFSSSPSTCRSVSSSRWLLMMSLQQLPDKSVHSTHCQQRISKPSSVSSLRFVTSLFNKLLFSSFVPDAFKVAYISPLVNKSGMDTGDVKSNRPISNLSVASKLLEKIAAKQLTAYIVCFAATASICTQDWPLVRDCCAQRYCSISMLCADAIRFICSLRHGRPPHSSAAPGALLWHSWFGTSMIPSLIWLAIANSSELVRQLCL